MASVQFTDVQARLTEFLDMTSRSIDQSLYLFLVGIYVHSIDLLSLLF